MQNLEVRELGLITGLGKNFEASLDEGSGAAAENGLLAEEVGLGLFGEGGLENTGAGAADALGVAERELKRLARGVLLDGNQSGNAAAFGEDLADAVAGSLGSDQRDIDACRTERWFRNGC